MKIALITGGRSSERDISIKTGKGVNEALLRLGHDVAKIDIDKPSIKRLVNEDFDLAFIALHGKYGEDGMIQGLLEILEIKYTGSGVLSSSIAMDKCFCQQIMRANDVTVPDFIIIDRAELSERQSKCVNNYLNVKGGCVIKPGNEGSSIGLSIVREQKNFMKKLNEALKYSDKALVEEYINGTEITVGVLGNDEPEALPPVEIVPHGEFFDFTCKYQKGQTDYYVPARISESNKVKLKKTASRVHRLLGLRGFSRSDFMLTDDNIYFLEVNTMPGMTETSLLPKAAAAVDLDYERLVAKIIDFAMEKGLKK